MSNTISQTNILSLHHQNQDANSISDILTPPPYTLDEERQDHVSDDEKRLRAICPDADDCQNGNAPQAPVPNQAVFKEEFYESRPYHQRRVCCLSLFWFAVICDICATVVALLGTMGATLQCRARCVDNCYDICNPKSEKGLIASLVIFVILSSAILVFKVSCCCRGRKTKLQHGTDDPPASK
ncbi:uncharacterized protein ATC70_012677 [Mucor velutinosus]|uniref:Uncharacterized protein n=1 Tax=Mucor velutinosus TaxID=708070 RepID=A0AAN7HY14_9FUNG|nr:hypothetical protein ATC70_012677 [Mucor velutinosus]